MIARLVMSLLLAAVGGVSAVAQSPSGSDALKRDVEQRFQVLPLLDGIALQPRASGSVRSIELSNGTIALDGAAVTGAELRQKLGADADLVIRLSYLSDAERRTLFRLSSAPESSSPRVEPAVPAQPPIEGTRPRRRSGDRVRFGGSINVGENEIVNGDIVAIGGPVRVEGQVRGDVVAIGGGLTLGPKADVSGDVVSIGGELSRDPASHIGGEVRVEPFEAGEWWRRMWGGTPLWRRAVGSTFALAATIARLAVLCLLAVLVILLGRDYVERIGIYVSSEPLKAGAIGFLSQLLFVPLLITTVVMLIVTIIGIPLLVLIPFAILALVLVALVGFTAVALQIGRALTAKMGWSTTPYTATIAGVLVLASPLLIARLAGLVAPITFGLGIVGGLVEYLAWTIGFGAVALTRFSKGAGGTAGTAALS